MMVVMLGDEIEVVEQAHGGFEARVRNRQLPQVRVESIEAPEQGSSRISESGKNVIERASIVVGFSGSAIGQVRRGEFGATVDVVFHSGQPQGFKIFEVPGMFLRGPLAWGACDQQFGGPAMKRIVEPGRGAAQTCSQIRQQLDG